MIDTDLRTRKSLRLSIYDGVFASMMSGFTQEYFSPYLISVGASVRQIGLLSAVPNLVASLAQLRAPELSERLGSRKRVLSIFVALQAAMLVILSAMPFAGSGGVLTFIACVTLFTSFGAFATPAWGSMMSDLVPADKRGEYFGSRTMLLGFTTILATFSAGLIIQAGRHLSPLAGFGAVFGAASLFRMISWHFLRGMHEPPFSVAESRDFTFLKFISGVRRDAFGRFVAAVSLMNFSVNIAAPFFALLMLRHLKFSYLTYTAVIITASISVFLTIRRWGIHADRVGNIKVIRATSRLITVLPLLWIVSGHPAFLILIQVLAGLLWSGFNLSASNFVYDAVPPEHRTRSIAYFNVINGTAIFCGSLSGGILVEMLPPIAGNSIFSVFLVSAVLRALVHLTLVSRLREVRPVKKVRSLDLFFSIVGIRPLLGVERKTLRY